MYSAAKPGVMRMKKAYLLLTGLGGLLLLVGVSAFLLMERTEIRLPHSVAPPDIEQPVNSKCAAKTPAAANPDVLFHDEFKLCRSADARVRMLAALSSLPWAKSDTAALKDAMLLDSSQEVRGKAFEVALSLSLRETDDAQDQMLREAICSPHQDVLTLGLRQCRIQPREKLLDELLKCADGVGAGRYLAVHALAQLKDARAQERVLSAAKDQNAPKVERARAIALLARSHLPAAIEYLKQIACCDDQELSRLARETLEGSQANPPK